MSTNQINVVKIKDPVQMGQPSSTSGNGGGIIS